MRPHRLLVDTSADRAIGGPRAALRAGWPACPALGLSTASTAVTPASFCTLTRKVRQPCSMQLRLRRTLLHLDAALGIDVDADQAMPVEDFLDLLDVTPTSGQLPELFCIGCRKGIAQHLERIENTNHLCSERLVFYSDNGQIFSAEKSR